MTKLNKVRLKANVMKPKIQSAYMTGSMLFIELSNKSYSKRIEMAETSGHELISQDFGVDNIACECSIQFRNMTIFDSNFDIVPTATS